MDAANSTASGFTSVLASTKFAAAGLPPQIDYVIDTIASASMWTVALTVLALCVAYDQSMSFNEPTSDCASHARPVTIRDLLVLTQCAQSPTS